MQRIFWVESRQCLRHWLSCEHSFFLTSRHCYEGDKNEAVALTSFFLYRSEITLVDAFLIHTCSCAFIMGPLQPKPESFAFCALCTYSMVLVVKTNAHSHTTEHYGITHTHAHTHWLLCSYRKPPAWYDIHYSTHRRHTRPTHTIITHNPSPHTHTQSLTHTHTHTIPHPRNTSHTHIIPHTLLLSNASFAIYLRSSCLEIMRQNVTAF